MSSETSIQESKMIEIILPKTKEIGFDTPGPSGAGSTELRGPTRLIGPTGHATFTQSTRV